MSLGAQEGRAAVARFLSRSKNAGPAGNGDGTNRLFAKPTIDVTNDGVVGGEDNENEK